MRPKPEVTTVRVAASANAVPADGCAPLRLLQALKGGAHGGATSRASGDPAALRAHRRIRYLEVPLPAADPRRSGRGRGVLRARGLRLGGGATAEKLRPSADAATQDEADFSGSSAGLIGHRQSRRSGLSGQREGSEAGAPFPTPARCSTGSWCACTEDDAHGTG